jgi:hypothetical protein
MQASRRISGVEDDVAFVGRFAYLPMLMHQSHVIQSLAVLRGIMDDNLIGPYLLPLLLTGDI